MQEVYSVEMALMDFVPNLAYLAGALFLVKLVLLLRGRPCSRMFMAGAVLIFLGGTLKATWKLIYAATGTDLTLLSQQQFVLLAFGFFATIVSVVLIIREKKKNAAPAMLAMAGWKIPFLAVMTICQIGSLGILTYFSFRRGAKFAAALFIVTVLCTFAMASLASAEQTVAMQWIEQSINAAGQVAFAFASWLLYRYVKQNLAKVGC